jgi:aspartyl-tRNA(Asn)/glutamyl-tRNA(Gln) amidotransferase subunit A
VSDPALLTLAQAQDALRRRELSASDLFSSCKKRIERWQPRVNAFIEMYEETAGVPLAHKDMFYRAGRVSNCGSKILRGWKASHTATALTRLDAAGFGEIGTLNMSEFAYGPTGHNEHWGDCRNPWDTDSITGGSSSGSGAAVAARLVYGALGSDTGGSVRLPAAACGVTGLKTTWGRVSRHGAMPLSHSLDTIGPLARTAEDCAILLQAIAGHDPLDPICSGAPLAEFKASSNLKIGTSTAWIERNAHPEVAAAVLAAVEVFRKSGHQIVEVEPPDFDTLSSHCLVVMGAEASAQHIQWMRERPQDYGSATRARLETGYAIPATTYLEVLRLRSAWLERFCAGTLKDVDAYLVPAIAVPIPTREQTGPKGGPDMPKLLAEVTRLTRWVNYLGIPALVAPCGVDARGLPIALQLAGRPFSESTLLAAGHAYQRETDWHERVPSSL